MNSLWAESGTTVDTTPRGRREQTDCESQHQVVSQTLADVCSPRQAASLPPTRPPQPLLRGAPRQHSSGRRATPAQRHAGALGSETRAHTPCCCVTWAGSLGSRPAGEASWGYTASPPSSSLHSEPSLHLPLLRPGLPRKPPHPLPVGLRSAQPQVSLAALWPQSQMASEESAIRCP